LKRKVIDELILWKDSDKRKSLLLTGAKGVGKTYLAYDFAKAFFEHIFYVNLERESGAFNIFLDPDVNVIKERLLNYIGIEKGGLPESKLLILDEFDLNSNAIRSLTLFEASKTFPHMIVISSKPVQENWKENFECKLIHPLEFDEFLLATGNEWYIEAIINHYETNKKIPEIVHKELLALHHLYLRIGGMPGVINEYLGISSLVNVSEQHSQISSAYHDYIFKDNLESDALKMNQVFDSIALQLMRENKKFQYKLIRKGTTYAMYKDAIQRLTDQNYILQSDKLSSEQIQGMQGIVPLDSGIEESNLNFKLYLPDTGLLFTKMIEEKGIRFNQQMENALLENFVAQSLHSKGYRLAFWESDSMAKIEFILLKDNVLLPIELHSSDNTRSKNISVLKLRCDFPFAIKISSKNFDYTNQIKYVPYYAVFCL
jgi:predicted AAA+ superfamily ATPase